MAKFDISEQPFALPDLGFGFAHGLPPPRLARGLLDPDRLAESEVGVAHGQESRAGIIVTAADLLDSLLDEGVAEELTGKTPFLAEDRLVHPPPAEVEPGGLACVECGSKAGVIEQRVEPNSAGDCA